MVAQMNGRKSLILLLFFLSGATGLVYEVLWSKLLAFVFGNSTSATAAVLAAFMGGLAIGSYLAGQLVSKWKRLIVSYGAVEGAVGLYCIALPWLLKAARPLLAMAYSPDGASWFFGSIRLVLVLALLLVPSTLMGMTFPILGEHFARREERTGRFIGLLYGLNCFGAVIGALASSFILIPNLGLFGTTLAAGLTNLSIFASTFWIENSRDGRQENSKKSVRQSGTSNRKSAREEEPIAAIQHALLAIFALAGVASMVYQIAWTRVFSLLFGSSVYTFSVILAAFIGGLSLGSFLISGRLDSIRKPEGLMAKIEAGIGMAGFAITALLRWAPLAAAVVYPDLISFSFITICIIQFASIGLLILLPTTLMGMLMPLVGHYLAKGSKEPGKALGTIYSANTVGCIIGSLAGGFLLVPQLGLRNSLLFASALNVMLASWLWCRADGLKLQRVVVPALAIAICCAIIPNWDTEVLTSGPYVYAKMYHKLSERNGGNLEATIRSQGNIIYHKEGESCVITVRRFHDGVQSLHVNGKTDASTHLDMKTQLLVSHLPALCAEKLDNVMAVGLGCGASLGAFQAHPCKHIDCLEICPEIVEAAELFTHLTHHDTKDPRTRLVVDDGRTYMDLNDKKYDVVMSEPSNPWVAGMTYLFTKEYFELCRSRLENKGVMCQWIHAYSMASSDFRSVLKTFQSVFPNTTLWKSDGKADYIMIGFNHNDTIPWERFAQRFSKPEVQRSLASVGLKTASSVLDHFLGGPEVVAEMAQGGRMVTDDNLTLEYTAPYSLFTLGLERIYAEVAQVMRPEDIAKVFEGPVIAEMASNYKAKNRADKLVKKASRLIDEKDITGALLCLKESVKLNPGHKLNRKAYEALLFLMGRRSYAIQNYSRAIEYFEEMLVSNPNSAEGHNNLGNCYTKIGKFAMARARYKMALAIKPDHMKALTNLAVVCSALEENEEAITSFEKVIKMGRSTAAIHNNLALLYVKTGKMSAAADNWRRALKVDPLCAAARKNLARLEEMARAG